LSFLTVEISVTGLGCLQNTVAEPSAVNDIAKRLSLESHLANLNLELTAGGSGLTTLGGKQVNVQKIGKGPQTAVFVHGLGATSEYYTPIIKSGDFEEQYTSYVYDLEGHGLSPTNIASIVTIESFAQDLANVINLTGAGSVTLFAHSLGCLIAMSFAIRNTAKVNKLVLMGPVPCPLPEAGRTGMTKRAAAVREKGMLASGTADAVSNAGTSSATKLYNPVAYTAVRGSLLSQVPEGYAKACMALAGTNAPLAVEKLTMPVLLMTGDEDKTSPVKVVTELHERLPSSQMEILSYTGHWHVYESAEAVSRHIKSFVA
jgi:pimeloyl-ACP methyl ester carboxylesterase